MTELPLQRQLVVQLYWDAESAKAQVRYGEYHHENYGAGRLLATPRRLDADEDDHGIGDSAYADENYVYDNDDGFDHRILEDIQRLAWIHERVIG